MMDEQLKTNLTSPKHWVRLIYMILFAFFLYIAAFVMSILVVVQFIFSLLTGSDNHQLRSFGFSLTTYIQQALMFLSFNSEFKPFPFADWPEPLQKTAGTTEQQGTAHATTSHASTTQNFTEEPSEIAENDQTGNKDAEPDVKPL